MNTIEKTSLIVLLVSYSGYLFALHIFERLYPINILYIVVVSGAIAISLYQSDSNQPRTGVYLLYILFVSVSYKTSPFVIGESLLGTDPDRFARSVHQIIATGTTEQIYLSFYSSAPVFPILSALLSFVSDISAYLSVISMTVIYAIGLPLAFYYFSRLFINDKSILMMATLFFTCSASSTIYSFVPIGQSLSNIYLLFSFILLFRSLSRNQSTYLLQTVVFGVAMMYTHKFGTIVISVLGGIFILIAKYNPRSKISNQSIRYPMYTVLALGIFTLVQWVYISGFLDVLAIRIVTIFTGGSEAILSDPPLPTHAEQINQGILDTVLRRGYVASIMVTGTLSFLLIGIAHFYSPNLSINGTRVYYLYSLGVLLSVLVLFSLLFSSAINPIRAYIYAEPIMVASIFLLFTLIKQKQSAAISGACVLIAIVLFSSQIITPMAIPDHPDRERQYLVQSETEPMGFEEKYIDGQAKMDNLYSHKLSNKNYNRPNRTESYSGREILNNSIEYNESEYAYIRTTVETYRLFDEYRGWWRLTYDPSEELATDSQKIYTNPGVDIYTRRS